MDPQDIDELVASATRPEKTIPLCLRADLREQWETLDAELRISQATTRQTLGASKEQKDLAKRIKDLEADMATSTLQVRMRAMTRPAWRTLMLSHPPRKDSNLDQAAGYNVETFNDDLVIRSIVEPERTEQQWNELFDVITSKQYDDLVEGAWELNRRDTSSPVFSLAASLVIPDSGEKSRQQSGSGSARRGSRASNPKS